MINFGYIVKTSVLALGLIAFGVIPAATAMSGQKIRGHKGSNSHQVTKHHSSNSHQNNRHRSANRHHNNGHQSSNRHHNGHRYYNSHNYGHNYNWRYNYGYGTHGHGSYYYSGHGNDVALGLLAGGLLYYGLTADQRDYNYGRNYNSGYGNRVVVQQQRVPQQNGGLQWTSDTLNQPLAQPLNAPTKSPCLQTREYQTTITVGDQTVPAYGQSCLMPDGTWKLGPAYPEPDFNN